MGRFSRVVVPEFAHHVTQRGNARRDVFFSPQDRQVYLGLLRQYSEHYALRILGYCLMTNHVHLVAWPRYPDSLAKTLREVHGRYARYRNALERSSGHLWQCRYYSCALEGVRLPNVMRYVELNPVRAGLVQSAADFAWSSAVTHLGGTDAAQLVDLEQWRREWSPEAWARWLLDGEGRIEDMRAIREATHAGRPLGSLEFVRGLESQWERRLEPGKAGRPRKAQALGAA
jgi:putative transposase